MSSLLLSVTKTSTSASRQSERGKGIEGELLLFPLMQVLILLVIHCEQNARIVCQIEFGSFGYIRRVRVAISVAVAYDIFAACV